MEVFFIDEKSFGREVVIVGGNLAALLAHG